jgi:general stress protein CsbA
VPLSLLNKQPEGYIMSKNFLLGIATVALLVGFGLVTYFESNWIMLVAITVAMPIGYIANKKE